MNILKKKKKKVEIVDELSISIIIKNCIRRTKTWKSNKSLYSVEN